MASIEQTRRVVQASIDTAAPLGIAPAELLGHRLKLLLSPAQLAVVPCGF